MLNISDFLLQWHRIEPLSHLEPSWGDNVKYLPLFAPNCCCHTAVQMSGYRKNIFGHLTTKHQFNKLQMRVQQLLCHCPPHLLFSHSQLRWLRWRLTTVQGRDIYVSLPLFVLNLQSVMSTYIPPHNKLLKNDEFTSAVYGDSFITFLKESPRQKRAAGTPLNTCSTPFL